LITPPVVKTFSLEEIRDAMDFVRSGKAHGRVVIKVKL
jgi:D-arabinose 1-dehydrogenase-like Zn-dependent alcohol dehydrogenase